MAAPDDQPEGLPDRRATGVSPRTGIDCGAGAAFVFEWVIAIGGYLFTVLVAGLIGGMLGGFVDGAFSLGGTLWVGYGRQGGWLLGILVAAVGLPLGWVRPGGKKFSLPASRTFGRDISARVSPRRWKERTRAKSAADTEEIRGVADVVKTGGFLGLVGLILGFVLGMFLLMGWFSLAISPFAPGGWFDAIDFLSTRGAHDQRGMSVSTSHPIAVVLAVSPALFLGGLGLVGGITYGLFDYVRYLRSVPRDMRARHRRERRVVLRSRPARWYMLLIGIVVFLAGGILTPWAAREVIRAAVSRSWPQVAGRITESKIESSENSEGDPSYSAAVIYTYEVDGHQYTGNRISHGALGGGSFDYAHSLVRRYPARKDVQVAYDPARPEHSVLEPGQTPGTFLFLGFGGLILTVGFFILFVWTERIAASWT